MLAVLTILKLKGRVVEQEREIQDLRKHVFIISYLSIYRLKFPYLLFDATYEDPSAHFTLQP